MKNDITSLSWMDKITRERALTKLSLITDFIGSPEDYDTYDSVVCYFI
jgi:predicted metalloendopeptidase